MIELTAYAMVFVGGLVLFCLPEILGTLWRERDSLRADHGEDAHAKAVAAKRERKQQIFEEMQRAKRTGAAYRLPDDWDD